MLHMVISKHAPDSCPGRAGNEEIFPCMQKLDGLFDEKGIKIVGRWADPPAHVNYLVLDAVNAHVIHDVFMASGMFGHTTTEVRAVYSMD